MTELEDDILLHYAQEQEDLEDDLSEGLPQEHEHCALRLIRGKLPSVWISF